jgi:hypothetical protein
MTAQNLMANFDVGFPQVLVSQQLAASETTQYTGPENSAVKIASAVLTNTSGGPVTVSVSVVKTGGTAGAANRVLSAYSLAAGDSTVLTELVGTCLGQGDFLSAIASSATSVTFVVSGVVFS